MKQKPPELTKCPQCSSEGCGPMRCRFSLIEHTEYTRILKRIERAASIKRTAPGAHVQIVIDQRAQSRYASIADKLRIPHCFKPRAHSTEMIFNTQEQK